MLDNINYVQVYTYKDLVELKNWLIKEKGKEHNIEIVAFDTGDELALIADQETIRQSNIETPKKQVKSIKAAFGGYTAGEKYSANDIIKPYMSDLQKAGFGTWVIAHTKFKSIKEKGSLETDGYMQLTSNMGADYEAAFGDIFDVTLTGVIDRDIEEVGEGDNKKRYATDTIRKLYFRETPLIDAGGRFAFDSVPEYMVFDKPNMAYEFIKIVEEGMEKSKLSSNIGGQNTTTTVSGTLTIKPTVTVKEEVPFDEEEEEDTINENTADMVDDMFEEENDDAINVEQLMDEVKVKFKACTDKGVKAEVRAIIKENGGTLGSLSTDDLVRVHQILQ